MSEAPEKKAKRRWTRPALVLAVLAGVAAFLWRPGAKDGELIVSLPISSRSLAWIDVVPPESDEVCVSIISERCSERWLVGTGHRKAVKLDDFPPFYSGHNTEVLAARENTVIYRDNYGAYSKPRHGGKPRLLTDTKGLFHYAGTNVIMHEKKIRGSAGHSVFWLLDLQTGRKKMIALPRDCELLCSDKGNAATPAIVQGHAPDERGHLQTHVWLTDSEGRIQRDVIPHDADPLNPLRMVSLDGKGNLYLLGYRGVQVQVYEARSAVCHKLARFAPRETGVMMDGTQQGAFVGVRRSPVGEAWLYTVINLLYKAGQMRAARFLQSAVYPYRRSLKDVWYYSPTGSVRRRVARRVDTFASSPEGDTMYFIRGRELRCVKLSEVK